MKTTVFNEKQARCETCKHFYKFTFSGVSGHCDLHKHIRINVYKDSSCGQQSDFEENRIDWIGLTHRFLPGVTILKANRAFKRTLSQWIAKNAKKQAEEIRPVTPFVPGWQGEQRKAFAKWYNKNN